MSEYNFVTVWKFTAPIENVWMEIKSIRQWPHWWNGVVKVDELEKGEDDGLNSIYRLTFKSALPYSLSFHSQVVAIRKMNLIEANVFGELHGKGVWTFYTENNLTIVRYDWKVKTNKWWMNLLAPIARPAFEWNHDYIMNRGGESLAKRLNCALIR